MVPELAAHAATLSSMQLSYNTPKATILPLKRDSRGSLYYLTLYYRNCRMGVESLCITGPDAEALVLSHSKKAIAYKMPNEAPT